MKGMDEAALSQPHIPVDTQVPLQQQSQWPAPPPPDKFAQIRELLSRRKSLVLLIVGALCLSLGTGAYVFVAASQKQQSQHFLAARETAPTPIPTDTPIPPTPTEIALPTLPPKAKPTITPTPTITINSSQSWNTYINTINGYTVQYPINWNAINFGSLDPQITSYIVFNPNTASVSARAITISVSTRTYQEQLALGATNGTQVTIASIQGTQQQLQDSDGNQSVSIILPRTNNLLILHAKTNYMGTLNQMISTLTLNN